MEGVSPYYAQPCICIPPRALGFTDETPGAGVPPLRWVKGLQGIASSGCAFEWFSDLTGQPRGLPVTMGHQHFKIHLPTADCWHLAVVWYTNSTMEWFIENRDRGESALLVLAFAIAADGILSERRQLSVAIPAAWVFLVLTAAIIPSDS